MIKKELKSYRKILTRDSAQKLYVFRRRNCENDCCRNDICNNDINIKNCLSNLNNLTNETIFKLIINAFYVKIKIIDFTTLLFLFYNKLTKIELLIKNRIYL